LSSVEVRLLWEEPTEGVRPTSEPVGILSVQGEEDVKPSEDPEAAAFFPISQESSPQTALIVRTRRARAMS
jgi:hypothetical protein